jgi:hypothetical protein
MPKIKVHEKALAHLSRGLYRSPASALRELVSNAWDANATTVNISTNSPLFHQLSVQDNGDGFSKDEFVDLMAGGIGNSAKRVSGSQPKFKRPIIGRLGIGMLGIAQICGSFRVTSIPRQGDPFRAQIHLYDMLKERLDSDDSGLVTTEDSHGESLRTVDVGEYKFELQFDPSGVSRGTTIASDDINPIFISSFQETLKDSPKPPLDWAGALKIMSRTNSLQELGDYWRLLWELAAACPVPYLSNRAVPHSLVMEDQARLESYRFKVVVDGIRLFKPVNLRGNKGGYTTRKIGPKKVRVYGKDLAYHGYIAVQEGVQLKPDELRGIMIRIKNVGIGYYDQTMLDYRFNQGPRSRWLTGEIYVDEGLEDALNIDRDSFNRFHPEFKEIQEHIHQILKDEIFPAVYKNASSAEFVGEFWLRQVSKLVI